jgi:hypothetical protein
MRRFASIVAGAAVLAAIPAPALADPPSRTGVQPGPLSECRRPTLACVRRVVRRMSTRWRTLHRSCDHRAVFALTYLRTTQGVLRTLRRDPGFFDDRKYLILEDVLFARLYFRAFDAWEGGRPGVPAAWRIAFRTNDRGDANGGQDVLLGMNAHIQRDLPYVLAKLGLRRPNGASRKPDHDRVNLVLGQVIAPIQAELARRYDPVFAAAPVDELATLGLLKSWREVAWRNAERLRAARTRAERRVVESQIGAYSRAWAALLAQPQQPGYRAVRDAHCRARH